MKKESLYSLFSETDLIGLNDKGYRVVEDGTRELRVFPKQAGHRAVSSVDENGILLDYGRYSYYTSSERVLDLQIACDELEIPYTEIGFDKTREELEVKRKEIVSSINRMGAYRRNKENKVIEE